MHPLLFYIARKTGAELAPVVEYLQAENAILRSMLPKHIRVDPKDRAILLKLGLAIGAGLRFLISIVTYTTFLKWGRDAKFKDPAKKKSVGRPKTDVNLVTLIIQLAAANAWGATRIYGELLKFVTQPPSKSTIRNLLVLHGFDPGPKRAKGTWADFIERHAKTLWACDFLSKKVWTKSGFQDCFALFFLHVATRRVYLAGVTVNPSNAWVEQQARNFVMHLDESPEAADKGDDQKFYLIQDHDGKFTAKFRRILKDGGVKPVRTCVGAPVMNSHAERWVQSFRRECLDHFIVFGVKHFLYLATEYCGWYNTDRPHQNRGNRTLPVAAGMTGPPAVPGAVLTTTIDPKEIGCVKRCGGLLKHYFRKAA